MIWSFYSANTGSRTETAGHLVSSSGLLIQMFARSAGPGAFQKVQRDSRQSNSVLSLQRERHSITKQQSPAKPLALHRIKQTFCAGFSQHIMLRKLYIIYYNPNLSSSGWGCDWMVSVSRWLVCVRAVMTGWGSLMCVVPPMHRAKGFLHSREVRGESHSFSRPWTFLGTAATVPAQRIFPHDPC